MYFVDDDETLKGTECVFRRFEPPAVGRRLEIEVRAPWRVRRNGPREGGLAALARPGQGGDRVDGKRLPDAPDGHGSMDETRHDP